MATKNRTRVVIPVAVVALALIVAGYFAAADKGLLPWNTAVVSSAAADTTVVADEPEAVDEDATPAVPVEVAEVARRGVAAFHRAASSVEADRLVDVTCRTGGRVSSVSAEEGQWVEQGAVLAELENSRQKVELRRAELKLEEQDRKLTRSRQMLGEELISQEEFDAVRATHDQAEAERDLARITLDETYVKAPFAGQVTRRAVVQGQMVQAAEAAYTVADFSPLRVRVHLPETVATKVRESETVMLESEVCESDLTAVVERISPVVDPGTGTVQVTLRLPDQARVRVGGFVKARLTTDRKHDVLAVPKLALVEEGGLRSVFVAEADTVRKVEITTGLYDETHVEITSGLEEGWVVVTLGRGGLRTGSRVEVLDDSNLAELAAR